MAKRSRQISPARRKVIKGYRQDVQVIGPRRLHGERLSSYRFRQARHALLWAFIWGLPAVFFLIFYALPQGFSPFTTFLLFILGLIAGGAFLLGCFYAGAAAWRLYLESHPVARYFWRQFKELVAALFMLALGGGVLIFLSMVLFRIQIPFGDERQTVRLGDDMFAHWMVFLFLSVFSLGLFLSGVQKLKLLYGR